MTVFTTEDVAAANALLDRIAPILQGGDPDVVGIVLAVLVARGIAGFQLSAGTPTDIVSLQTKMLLQHIDSVNLFIPIEAKALDDALARGEITSDRIKTADKSGRFK
jgi:hypothetical protein